MIAYTDSEVKVFQPICESALKKALSTLKLSRKYRVSPGRYIGSLKMDLAIENIKTGKYLCVIEIKKTCSAVQSTRYQYQAKSYVESSIAQNEAEKPYYVITNLERLISFRYDNSRPGVAQQMLQPGMEQICEFSTDKEKQIESKLSKVFERLIDSFINDKYDYFNTLGQFLSYMDKITSNKKWKSSLAILLYEYIRGAFKTIHRTKDFIYDVRKFKNDVEEICIEGNKVDFDGIFDYNASSFSPKQIIKDSILDDLFKYGEMNVSGDAVADALYEEVTNKNRRAGEVATDLALAMLASTLAKMSNGNLGTGKKICDPAAGSGNLICSAISVFNVEASSIKANDINKKLIELLSLRLGLSFPRKINKSNAPEVSSMDINKLPKGYFNDVDVVLLNPPFVAGINSVSERKRLYNTISRIKKTGAETQVGQMNLAAVFLEAICCMVNKGTTIVCIFPKAHLKERGDEAIAFRRMLLSDFGLHTIFNYPATELFENVTEETCIFVGKVGVKTQEITVYSSDSKVVDLDLHSLENYCGSIKKKRFSSIIPGVEARLFTYSELKSTVKEGWRQVCSEMTEAMSFMSSYIMIRTPKVFQASYNLHR